MRFNIHNNASMPLRVLVYDDPEKPDYFVAHCLELDIVGAGRTMEGALSELLENIEVQANACKEYSAQFLFPAPPAGWSRYDELQRAGDPAGIILCK